MGPGSATHYFIMRRARDTSQEFADPASLRERDRADVAAVVGLGAMGRAAVAEEIFRLPVGANPEVLDPADLRPLEPVQDITGEVEHGVAAGLRAGKEPRVLRVDLKEPRDELRADLV